MQPIIIIKNVKKEGTWVNVSSFVSLVLFSYFSNCLKLFLNYCCHRYHRCHCFFGVVGFFAVAVVSISALGIERLLCLGGYIGVRPGFDDFLISRVGLILITFFS